MFDKTVDDLATMIGWKRWYDKPGAKITKEMGNKMGDWLKWHKDMASEHITNNEKIIFDWKNLFFDNEHNCLRVAGYLPTEQGSVHDGKIAGTTLLWNIPWDFTDLSSVKMRLDAIKASISDQVINIFMHGHTGNPADVQGAALKRQRYDLARGISSIQLSLGLMGADGTCISSEVGDGETPLAQVESVLDKLEQTLPLLKQKIGLVWGHSMQGNTVLLLAAKRSKELPYAEFDAVAPVIVGSDEEKDIPEDQKHVLLHAGWRGALVKFLPVVHLIPNKRTKRLAVGVVNWMGIPAKVLGYYVRDAAMAAIHFAECIENPYYLARVNNMLTEMPDLRKKKDLIKRLAELGNEGRIWITIGDFDTILNPSQMSVFAMMAKVPVVKLGSGHFPKEEELGAAIGEVRPQMMQRHEELAFAV